MDRTSFGVFLAGILVCGAGATCTTSIDAIGGTGGSSVVGATANVSTGTTGSAGGPGFLGSGGGDIESPCGLYYDWNSCEVVGPAQNGFSLEQARAQLTSGAWRRCNETGDGAFSVGALFADNGDAFRMDRIPNPLGIGTENLVYCRALPADEGVWSLQEGTGGESGSFLLSIQWDDGTVEAIALEFLETGIALGGTGEAPLEQLAPQAEKVGGPSP